MKKFTALALVAGLSATGAQAQYSLTYDATNGELSITTTGQMLNYVLNSNGQFLEDAALTATNHTPILAQSPVPGFEGIPQSSTQASTPNVLSESNAGASEFFFPARTASLGLVLPAGLSEGGFNDAIESTEYVTALGSPKQSFNLVYVPEPTSLALLGLGGLLVARRRRSA